MMRHARDNRHGFRLRAMIVMLWRGGLRVSEAIAFAEHDLDLRCALVLVRCGKGGRRREVGMDGWGLGEASGPGSPSASNFRQVRSSHGRRTGGAAPSESPEQRPLRINPFSV